jgi:thiamine-phosphate pyrophosphorylase
LPRERKPIFCYVTDRHVLQTASISSRTAPASPAQVPANSLYDPIRRALAAGAAWIQIREKDLDARSLVELARFAVVEARSTGARVIINDRLDVALAAMAGGIHLGEKSIPLAAIVEWRNSAKREDFLIGASCHTLDSAREAERGGADYIFFGPIFATPSKAAYGEPQGLARLGEVTKAVKIPVLAIGGMNQQNAKECIAAGAAGIAAIRMYSRTGFQTVAFDFSAE